VAQDDERRGLRPMGPQQFDEVAAIPFPPRTPGTAPGDVAPETGAQTVVVISEQVPPVSGPMPLPRPAGWRSE